MFVLVLLFYSNKKFHTMKYGYFIILLTFFSALNALIAQKTLKYNLKEGDTYKITQQANQLITQQIEGSSHEITNELTGFFNFKVVGVDEMGFDIILNFQNFTLKTNSSIQGVLMDVNAKKLVEGDIMSEMFHAIIGYELSMRMTTNGSILYVKGGDELITKMISAASIEDEFNLNLMRKSLTNEFSSKGLADSFEQMTFFYPDTKVTINDTWENTYNGKLSANNTFKLEKIDTNTISISGNASIVINTEESGAIMSLSGSQESFIETNTKTGFIKKTMISSFLEGNTVMTQISNSEIPTTIKSTTTYKLLEN